MSGVSSTSKTAGALSAGFIGWGPESEALLETLCGPYPDIGDTAIVLAGGAGSVPPLRSAPSLEALFHSADLIFAEGGAAFLEPHLPLIRLAISDRHRLVLLGGDWSMAALLELLQERKLARCMLLPTHPGMMGTLAFLTSPYFSEAERSAFEAMFSHLDLRVELKDEAHFEVIRGLADFAPSALYTIIEAMADGVVMTGFPRDAAFQYLSTLLHGATERILEGEFRPSELREQALAVDVAAAGLIEMESAGIRGTMMRAIQRAIHHRGRKIAPSAGEKIDSNG